MIVSYLKQVRWKCFFAFLFFRRVATTGLPECLLTRTHFRRANKQDTDPHTSHPCALKNKLE